MKPTTDAYQTSADSIRFDGGTVHVCIGKAEARTCWAADIAKQQVVGEGVVPAPKDDAPLPKEPFPTATATYGANGAIELCPPDSKEGSGCKTFTDPKPVKEGRVNVSDDLATVTIGSGTDLRIYDVASGKLRGTIKAWPSKMGNDGIGWPESVQFAGDHMLVWFQMSPISMSARVFTLDGKQLAELGPKDFTVTFPNTRVAPTEYVNMQVDANNLVVIDLATAKQTTYDTKPLLGPRAADDRLPIQVYAAAKVGDRIVVVSGENPPSIGVLGPDGKLDRVAPPACK